MKKLLLLFGGICIVIVLIVFILNDNSVEYYIADDEVEITIIGTKKTKDNSVFAIAEIANNSDFTLEGNSLDIGSMSEEGGETHTNKSGETSGSATASADDELKKFPVVELGGSFDSIGSNDIVKIGFTIPHNKFKNTPLYVVFESWKLRKGNSYRTKATRIIRPLNLSE